MHAPFDPARLLAREFPTIRHEYTHRDVQLYALALGIAQDPMDDASLRFVYEGADGAQLTVLPTYANVLAYPGFWAREPDTGIDWTRIVHAEQSITLHRSLPASGSVLGRNRVSAIWDRGEQQGAFLQQRREILDAHTGAAIATVTQLSLLRGNGGSGGGTEGAAPRPHPMPSRAADHVQESLVPPQAALLYRLCGDLNPMHADPAVARAAGFKRPILHGMATMGIAAHAVVRGVLGNDVSRFAGMRVRFTSPAYPGEMLRTELWVDGDVVSLRTTALGRSAVVLDNACVYLRELKG